MSATETNDTETPEESTFHPTANDYIRIATILAVLTAMEVSTYFVDFGPLGIPLLVVLMIIKFVLVASWFMHLKFDSRSYSRLMYAGLLGAIVLYAGTLVMFAIGHFPRL